ncbi:MULTISPECIES: hypothetical protein [Chryseobacterium]|uniref:hypothetical protein n=1 Tax=Chryseobacterium TaxID=59732 RepID=UPI001BE86053|nr:MULTISPECIES: hypothetical protein [Chryseobacterium]MBT2622210.1 hypothetical protein [Chryseobacterium sp. ISL-6]
MKNLNLGKGKKLNKKELRVITGGRMICIDPFTGSCKRVGAFCAEPECRPDPIEPLN